MPQRQNVLRFYNMARATEQRKQTNISLSYSENYAERSRECCLRDLKKPIQIDYSLCIGILARISYFHLSLQIMALKVFGSSCPSQLANKPIKCNSLIKCTNYKSFTSFRPHKDIFPLTIKFINFPILHLLKFKGS